MQNIVYGQYLPEVLGSAKMDDYRLGIDGSSNYRDAQKGLSQVA